ncbi:MAG TPA: FAD-dependent oxidoreductase [Solirubrobacteraceae bacterium]|nr:FAD-dependent oxidoreductase [Solirubrobacteraceae bacterium]
MPAHSTSSPTVVIGAGPHGLATVAHLRAAGVPTRVFGEAMQFWRESMPAGMLLRSPRRASSISSPGDRFSLDRWARECGRELPQNLPLEDFLAYGDWFAEHVTPELDTRRVLDVRPAEGGFAVALSDGEELFAQRVVVAAGLAPFALVPDAFAELNGGPLVSHSATDVSLARFAGCSVAVIGAGQSALEGAALLCEAGAARVELIARTPAILWLGHGWIGNGHAPPLPLPSRARPGPPAATPWRLRLGLYWRDAPTDVGGPLSSWVGAAPDVIRHLPREARASLTYRCVRPAGAGWLADRLRSVTFTLGRSVRVAEARNGRAQLRLDDDSERIVDHVLLGTGYRIDVLRYPFLSSELATRLRVRDGSPLLGRGLESSVPGLHFTGAPAAESFGPAMRFVVGTAYTAPALTQRVIDRRRPLFRWAF